MFGGDRYQTIGIQQTIPLEVQFALWGLIDQARHDELELDYLQVFEIEEIDSDDGQRKLIISHKQEVPEWEAAYSLDIAETTPTVSAKIFVIDDGTHSTMLLASEY